MTTPTVATPTDAFSFPGERPVTPEVVREHNLNDLEYGRIVEMLGRSPDGWAVAFKIESHNHPSAVEPYQGAATGVGGILRDVFTMGARPVAMLNSLRFGPLDHPRNRYLFAGVVRGVGDYGNCVGVPTLSGEVAFAPGYTGNPLVNAMCVGLLREEDLIGIGISIAWRVAHDTGARPASRTGTQSTAKCRPISPARAREPPGNASAQRPDSHRRASLRVVRGSAQDGLRWPRTPRSPGSGTGTTARRWHAFSGWGASPSGLPGASRRTPRG